MEAFAIIPICCLLAYSLKCLTAESTLRIERTTISCDMDGIVHVFVKAYGTKWLVGVISQFLNLGLPMSDVYVFLSSIQMNPMQEYSNRAFDNFRVCRLDKNNYHIQLDGD